MQGAANAPAAPAAEPPSQQQIKTEEVISEAKVAAEEMDRMKYERQELRSTRTTSIDSDNRSDRSEEEDSRRARKRAASTSPSHIPMDKRTARFECPKCHQRFDSINAFDIHRFTAHGDDSRSGYADLVDFSKKKFPEITRSFERNHIDRFRCDLCTRDFPNAQVLDIHRKTCSPSSQISTPDNDRREDFFAKLDLRNRSFGIPGTLTPPMERFTPKFDDGHISNGIRHMDAARDLADIQSILHVTSAGSLLERLTGTRVLESSVLTPPDTISKDRDQEETQDNFAAEFRRMKLRGEFPCRLCPAKFPNLRALKGHNRVHLSGTGPGPYQCNMCPHASLDKAALVRHMRTHNGDRPYECAVCNYAFTTKANCERHLRNRHAKVTREDVKRSIIYHPSEDPNNDEVNSKIARDEVKRSLAFHTELDRRSENTGRDTPLTHFTTASFITDRHPVAALTAKPIIPEAPLTPREPEQPVPRIKVKGIGQLTQIPEFRMPEISYKTNDVQTDVYEEEDAPVDLSTNDNNNCDVLDLSKKKRDSDSDEPKTSPRRLSLEPESASAAATAFEKTRLLLAQQRLFENSIPNIDPAFYATQLSQLYAGGVTGLPGLPLPPSFPYFLQPPFFPHPSDSQQMAEIKQRIQKEIIRGLSMSGGRLVPNEQEIQPKLEPEPEEEEKPVPQVISPIPSPHSESPRPVTNSVIPQPDSVKMVIKNGVLMPKQKQRRYRTERPFSCSQCSARFTLRSNMERHVKQQHPQHWSVRRPAPRAPPPYPSSDALADRVKFALLARHLETPLQQSERSPIRRDSDEVADNEEDEDDALVIDEEPELDQKPEEHLGARRAAAEILMATCQQELHKDFDLKIAGNLINKPVPLTTEKIETGTDPIPLNMHEPLPVPVVPTRSDEEEDEEGLVASTSEGNNSGSDENKSESDTGNQLPKKKSAYSLAPNRVSCPYCHRKFPWSSSLRRHVLTHTGQKPFKCSHCPLLFTTKSNCDRHLLRKHGGSARSIQAEPIPESVSPPQQTNDIRTVPERPFKCATCPTSTFSTIETLKKHISSRHGSGESQPNSPNPEIPEDNFDGLVFKCHLCEASFGDRGGSLNHLANAHAAEYEQLISKGALDAASDRSESADDDDRGKFPDHANRKVVCAFCVRRFWSAEDLRRHMRTHSGERPFACDLCRRRFTLKHSMLRHRKKHREEITDDEEASPCTTEEKIVNGYRYQDDDSGNEIPNNVNNNNSPPAAPFEKKLKLDMTSRKYSSETEIDGENGSDLIGKLLGIPDKTINKILNSADEAAKILGVNK